MVYDNNRKPNRSNNGFGTNRCGDNRDTHRDPFVGRGVPSEIGLPFYNPYTFIPFPEKIERRDEVSYLTADEYEKQRFTGILDLTVKNISPLLTSEPTPKNEGPHKEYNVLTIGNDVIVPATSVRGSLRTLMTTLVGGTLGYMDRHLHLCQGRDVHCGPIQGNENRKAFLARVVKAGGFNRSGKIELGESGIFEFPKLEFLSRRMNIRLPRPTKSDQRVFVDDPLNPKRIETVRGDYSGNLKYEIKLAGRIPQKKGSVKKEGFFKSIGRAPIELPAEFWEDYSSRNRNGDRKELRTNDLIWIEPVNPDATGINSAKEIKSIQWARWGRCGQRFEDALGSYSCVKPDSQNPDGKVDSVTDLWGQVHLNNMAGKTFASRIRVHNLIFENGAEKLDRNVTLAPLAQPHPGCLAMYRSGNPNPYSDNALSKLSPLNGYKVYRNSSERGEKAPWLFSEQGVYDNGKLKNPKTNMNKTVDLLSEGQSGHLKISFRALSKKELAMLLLTCSVDWKLGGGKPLGLGHCRVTNLTCRDEFGIEIFPAIECLEDNIQLPEEYAALICGMNILKRIQMYKESQKPVDKLRYPRAAEGKLDKDGNFGIRREALLWFERHAKPKGSEDPRGLVTCIVNEKEYPGQVLGNMETGGKPFYGYELYSDKVTVIKGKKMLQDARLFNPETDVGDDVKRENYSSNARTRSEDRRNRR